MYPIALPRKVRGCAVHIGAEGHAGLLEVVGFAKHTSIRRVEHFGEKIAKSVNHMFTWHAHRIPHHIVFLCCTVLK